MKNMKSIAQAGFTLIELIVVIVILGILAATALPKFVDLGSDARLSSLNAAKGALSSSASMIKGKYLISGGTTATVEGTVVTYVVGNGYPQSNAAFATAAGLSAADYTILGPTASAKNATQPLVALGDLVFIPKSVAGTALGVTCYVKYSQPAAGTTNPPVIFVPAAIPNPC